MKRLASFIMMCVVAAAASAQGGVYVAGQGFSLEEAIEQAAREQRDNETFWVVASRDAALRLAQGGSEAGSISARVRLMGGVLVICGRDLPEAARSKLSEAAIVIDPGEAGAVAEDAAAPLPEGDRQHRLMLRTCGAFN